MKPLVQHTQQNNNNRLLPYIGNQGTINRIFNSRFLSEDTFALFAYCRDVMNCIKKPLVFHQNFTLVNIYFPYSKLSHGYCVQPPQSVIIPACSMVITFALRRTYYTDATTTIFKKRYMYWSYMWGETKDSLYSYYTLSIPITVVKQFKLTTIQKYNCYYIYNVLSSLLKNWIINTSIEHVSNIDQYDYNKRFYDANFIEIVNNHSYTQLPYAIWTWKYATNLISVDYDVAIYYFLNVDGTIPIAERQRGDSLTRVLYGREFNKESILTLLEHSIVEYNTNRKSNNLLLVASLYGNNNGYSLNTDYYSELLTIHRDSNLNVEKSDALSIINHTVKRFMLVETTVDLGVRDA